MRDLIDRYITKHGVLLVILISLIPLFPFIHPGLPLTHDGVDHVARIANFYQGLLDGNIIPRWGANLNWGFGHPVIMFLYPLSSYTASLFHFIGFSFDDSVKLVFVISYIFSGITMYLWARNQFDSYIGILSAVLYLYAPYRFIDLYVRGAIGEHVAFIFPPLILYFLYKFFNENANIRLEYFYFLGISFSSALLILGHNAISIMFLPLIAFYLFYLFSVNRNKKILILSILGIAFGFLLSSFFLLPAFIEGKYTLRDIVTGDEYKTRFIEPVKLLYGNWNYGITGQFSVQLGLFHLLGLILLPFVLISLKLKKEFAKIRLLIGIFVFFIISIFIMLPQSNFLYEIFTTLKKFQFPWRFLSLSTFTISVIASASLYILKNNNQKELLTVIASSLIIITSIAFYQANGYFSNPDSFYNSVYRSTTDTGESSPIWSIRFMEKEAMEKFEIVNGKAQYQELFRNSTNHKYSINVESENARFKDNTLYFPGWKVLRNSQEIPIEFQDPAHRGLLTFTLPKGEHELSVVFQETRVRLISNIISLISFSILIIILPFILFRKYA